MTRARNQTLLLALASCLLAACRSSAPAAAPSEPARKEMVLVLLMSGPTQPETPEAAREVFAGHFANMQRLARERRLLLAGPFAQPKRDPELRGLFVIDAAEVAEAERLAGTDPGVIAGVFRIECHALSTAAPLAQFLERELELEDAAQREGRTRPPGEGARGYVVLTAEDGERAEHELADLAVGGGVLLSAALDGTRHFAVLDAVNLSAAEALLGDRRGRLGAHVLDLWFASEGLAGLPQLQRAR